MFSVEGRETSYDVADIPMRCELSLSHRYYVFGQVETCDVRVWKYI